MWALSGYGTVFDQSNGPGILAKILGDWYADRKEKQALKKKYGKMAKEEKEPEKKAEYQALEELYDLLQLTKKIAMNSMYGALLNSAVLSGSEFVEPSPLHDFMFQEIECDGDKSIRVTSDIYMLFNQHRLDKLTRAQLVEYFDNLFGMIRLLDAIQVSSYESLTANVTIRNYGSFLDNDTSFLF